MTPEGKAPFSHGFPMGFPIFPWLFYGFSHVPVVLPWFSYGFSRFPMGFLFRCRSLDLAESGHEIAHRADERGRGDQRAEGNDDTWR